MLFLNPPAGYPPIIRPQTQAQSRSTPSNGNCGPASRTCAVVGEAVPPDDLTLSPDEEGIYDIYWITAQQNAGGRGPPPVVALEAGDRRVAACNCSRHFAGSRPRSSLATN